MTNLKELEAKLVAATGPSRELDGAIWMALENDVAMEQCSFKGMKYAGHIHTAAEKKSHIKLASARSSPEFTFSIDAAVSLCARVLPKWQIDSIGQADKSFWFAVLRDGHPENFSLERPISEHTHPNAALALCLAIIRALIAKEKSGE